MQHNVAMGRYPDYMANTWDRIKSEIISAGQKGISQKELISRTGIERTTIYRNIKKFPNQVKIVRNGKMAQYIAIDEIVEDTSLSALLLGVSFASKILADKQWIVMSKSYNNVFDFREYTKFFEPKFNVDSRLEKIIFEFSNRIGAYITYVLIQAMNPDIIDTKNKNDNETENNKHISEEWVGNAVSPVLNQFLWQFIDLLRFNGLIHDPWNIEVRRRLLKARPHERRSIMRQVQSMSKYIQGKETISRLLAAFCNIYPRFDYEMEEIMMGLPMHLDLTKEDFKNFEERSRQQKCKHEFRSSGGKKSAKS